MAGLNKVTLIGNIGQDPEITTAGSGTQIAKFSVATSDGIKAPGEDFPKTEWHRIVAFGKTAELIGKFFKKGSQICIEGRIQYGKYDNKDGVTIYTTDIIANQIVFIDKKEDTGQQQSKW